MSAVPFGAVSAVRDPRLLEVRDLRVWFPEERGVARAVDGLSLDVDEGEAVGLVGESGCGKTVASLAILGLPPAGARVVEGSSILLRGEELAGADEARLRRLRGNEVSMVFQEPATSLNPVLSVGEQIAEVLRRHRDLGRREARGEALRLLEEVRVPEARRRLDEYPHQLSGGMRQRVVIAMALACEPALLLADEPTTALDTTVAARILRVLDDLRTRRGLAVLLVSHDLGVVAHLCDRVVVMYAGQAVESGAVRDVLGEPLHPYTRALLGALPGARGGGRRLEPIPGSVPAATAWPEGCRFRERCPLAAEVCRAPQELVAVGAARSVRCWKAVAPAEAGT